VERTRQELSKLPARFDNLHVAAINDDSFFVVLSGLQCLQLVDGTNSWQSIPGLIQASRHGRSNKWDFAGEGQLGTVHFDIAQLDLNQVLAASWQMVNQPLAENKYSRENLASRLAAAQSIDELAVRDQTLAALAKDAATIGDVQFVQNILRQINQSGKSASATHDAALRLAKAGLRKQAVEMAKGIDELNVRDQTLSELAQ